MRKVYVLLDDRAWRDVDAAEVVEVADSELQAIVLGMQFPQDYVWYEYEINEAEDLVNGRQRTDLSGLKKSYKLMI